MNLLGKLTYALNWFDTRGNTRTLPPECISLPFTSSIDGAVQIPIGTVAGSEVDVVPGGVLSAATMLLIENSTGQELNTAWGGNWSPHLSDGGIMLWAMPSVPAGGRITTWRFFLTETQTKVNGHIRYWAFGA